MVFCNVLSWSILKAQTIPAEGSLTISEHLENAVSSNDEETDPTELADEMYNFLEHPLNINTASSEELRQLHLLTEFQIFSLLSYIKDFGELFSLFELKLIYGFDEELINTLRPFIRVSGSNGAEKKEGKKRFRNTLVFRTGLDPDKKNGFIPDTTNPNAYMGANRSLMLRYEAGFRNFRFGFTSDQDAGESFKLGGKYFSPDFTSCFLEYSGRNYLKKIIIGDFNASWGQGLVLGGYGCRKGTQVLLSPQSSGIKKYSSAGENDFLRGCAASFGWGDLNLEVFASNLKTDASLHSLPDDTLAPQFFNSPDVSGLHRNLKELQKKDAIITMSFGGHAQLVRKNIVWGFSYLNQEFSNKWVRNSTAYTQEIFDKGTGIQNIGSDFKVSMGKIALFGEIAADTKARMAIFSGFLAELHPLVRFSLAYRNYQPDYLGLRSSGFGESQDTKNEEGFYLGLQMYPWKYLKLDLYADHYSFPFLRYNSTNPYSGSDYLVNFNVYPSRELSCNLRFRYEKNQNRSTTCITGVDRMETAKKGGFRLELSYLLNKNIRLKSRIEFSYFQIGKQKMTTGFYSGHDFAFQTKSQKYKLWFRYAIYDIPCWDNRIYAYENDVLYSFSVPAFSSQGTRFIIMGKTDLLPSLELSIRFAVSGFASVKTTGTGEDEVKGISDSYLTMQLRFKI